MLLELEPGEVVRRAVEHLTERRVAGAEAAAAPESRATTDPQAAIAD